MHTNRLQTLPSARPKAVAVEILRFSSSLVCESAGQEGLASQAVLEEEIADGEVLQVAIKGVHKAAHLGAAHGLVQAEVELMVHGAVN